MKKLENCNFEVAETGLKIEQTKPEDSGQEEFYKRRTVEAQMYKEIWYAFSGNGIKMPYPVREIVNATPKNREIIFDRKKKLLQKVNIFKTVNEEVMDNLANQVKIKLYGKGEYLFFEDEPGDSFFIINSGEVEVLVKQKRVAILKEGNFFGEMSLLTGKSRNATIKAMEDSEMFVLDKEGFSKVIMEENITHLYDACSEKEERPNERSGKRHQKHS